MDNVQRARNIYDAFARGDIEAVLGAFHSDLEWSEAEGNPYQPSGAPFRGGQEVLEKLFARLGAEWDGFEVRPDTLHGCGDVVVMEGRYGGKVKATSRTTNAQVCHVLRFQDGKLIRFQQYVDTDHLRWVMGEAQREA